MASMNKVTDVLAAIKTIYPYYAKDARVDLLATTWAALLKDYDDKLVDAALLKCLQTCKMPPTPADIIEQIGFMTRVNETSDEELWSIYQRALRATADQVYRFNHTFMTAAGITQGEEARRKVKEIYEALPAKIKRYLGSQSELIRSAKDNNSSEDFSSWEKQRFMKAMPVMARREEYQSYDDHLLASGNGFLLHD